MATLSQNKDNTEGSLDCSIKVLKKRFKLSNEQLLALIGTLLGDGSLNKRGRFHRLHVKHSLKQISLVQHRRKIFANISSMPVRSFTQKVKGKTYKFCEFVTLTHSEFTRVHNWFYPNGKKHITKEILKKINHPICLANWFMDDGSAENAGLAMNTHCFTKTEVELLSKTMNRNFNLATNLRKNKGKWIIYVPKKDVAQFVQLTQPYILPEFEYKLVPYSQRN